VNRCHEPQLLIHGRSRESDEGAGTTSTHIRNITNQSLQKRKLGFDDECDDDTGHPGTSPRKRARFLNEGYMRPSSAPACAMPLQRASTGEILATREAEPVTEAAGHVSQWDWSSLHDYGCATGAPGHVEISAFQPKAAGELSNPGFRDASMANGGTSLPPQLHDPAWDATPDNGISLDIMSNLLSEDVPCDAPQDHWGTSGSPRSQRLVSDNDPWLEDHSVCVGDILQQDYGLAFDLQDEYNRLSEDLGLQGGPQWAPDSPSLAGSVQDVIQQSF
jgi:hypothetical protein